MFSRVSMVLLSVILFLVPQVHAKNKKKQLLPDYVLRAERVLVVIPPDAGESLTSPRENRAAQDEVERAITKWGRFKLAVDAQDADLIIAVRKGNKGGPVIMNSPADNRSIIFQPGTADASVGLPRRSPDMTEPMPGASGNRSPQLGAQMGSTDDAFEVYMGRSVYPLDAPPMWRYIAKNSLNPPQMTAVEEFRKAIEESEKQSRKP